MPNFNILAEQTGLSLHLVGKVGNPKDKFSCLRPICNEIYCHASFLVLFQMFHIVVCGRVPWLYQYWPGGFMFFFAVLCPGTNEGSTSIGSGFKASQKMGQWLKVSSDRLKEAWNRTCHP